MIKDLIRGAHVSIAEMGLKKDDRGIFRILE